MSRLRSEAPVWKRPGEKWATRFLQVVPKPQKRGQPRGGSKCGQEPAPRESGMALGPTHLLPRPPWRRVPCTPDPSPCTRTHTLLPWARVSSCAAAAWSHADSTANPQGAGAPQGVTAASRAPLAVPLWGHFFSPSQSLVPHLPVESERNEAPPARPALHTLRTRALRS